MACNNSDTRLSPRVYRKPTTIHLIRKGDNSHGVIRKNQVVQCAIQITKCIFRSSDQLSKIGPEMHQGNRGMFGKAFKSEKLVNMLKQSYISKMKSNLEKCFH